MLVRQNFSEPTDFLSRPRQHSYIAARLCTICSIGAKTLVVPHTSNIERTNNKRHDRHFYLCYGRKDLSVQRYIVLGRLLLSGPLLEAVRHLFDAFAPETEP